MTNYGNAIASVESGGRYDIVGPTHPKLGRALGKYQVMESNLPEWSRRYLGREYTPEEFLASEKAQDDLFNGRFGEYVQKHGPEGAARAWFAGEGGMNDPGRKDSLGTSVADYARKFNTALGTGQGAARSLEGGIMGSAPQAAAEAPTGILGGLGGSGQGFNPMALMSAFGGGQQNQGFLGPPGYSESPQPTASPNQPPGIPPPMRRRQIDMRALQALAQLQPRSGGAFSWSA
jgi:hypothetical protein